MSIQERTNSLLEQTGALKRGHFLLSSGLHSDRYCQCAALFEHPRVAGEVAELMRGLIGAATKVDVVFTPAIGGILWGYELARVLGARSLFAERKPGEPFEVRRGFVINPGERVLLAEDVVTTGKSVLELVPLVERAGGVIVGYAAVADRSKGQFRPAQPFHALTALNFDTWTPEACPLCKAGVPVVKPGSRALPVGG